MTKKAKKTIANVPKRSSVQPVTTKTKSFDLVGIRSEFDGLRAVAMKFPNGAPKTALLDKIERLYLAATSGVWGYGHTTNAA